MICDDDAQQYEGDHRATKQPIVSVQVVSQFDPSLPSCGGPQCDSASSDSSEWGVSCC